MLSLLGVEICTSRCPLHPYTLADLPTTLHTYLSSALLPPPSTPPCPPSPSPPLRPYSSPLYKPSCKYPSLALHTNH